MAASLRQSCGGGSVRHFEGSGQAQAIRRGRRQRHGRLNVRPRDRWTLEGRPCDDLDAVWLRLLIVLAVALFWAQIAHAQAPPQSFFAGRSNDELRALASDPRNDVLLRRSAATTLVMTLADAGDPDAADAAGAISSRTSTLEPSSTPRPCDAEATSTSSPSGPSESPSESPSCRPSLPVALWPMASEPPVAWRPCSRSSWSTWAWWGVTWRPATRTAAPLPSSCSPCSCCRSSCSSALECRGSARLAARVGRGVAAAAPAARPRLPRGGTGQPELPGGFRVVRDEAVVDRASRRSLRHHPGSPM